MENVFVVSNITEKGRAPAVDRAMAILKVLAQADGPRGVSEISRDIGVGKGSVHAIVQSLLAAGAVEDAPGRKYRLGPMVEELSTRRRTSRSLVERCSRSMERLRDDTRQTVMLGVVEDGLLRVLAVSGGSGALRLGPSPGMTLPLTGGATGIIAVAWKAVETPEKFLNASSAEGKRFRQAVGEARRVGVALDLGGWMKGVAAAAAPILESGKLKAILFAVGFSEELEETGLEKLGEAVAKAAKSLSFTD